MATRVAKTRKKPSPKASQREARRSTRHSCGEKLSCRLVADQWECWAIKVLNLSEGGVRLALDRVVPSGKLLTVELHDTSRRTIFERQARVIYTLQDPAGGLVMGGAFSPPLSEKDLARFLT
jgi:hypothetical protein